MRYDRKYIRYYVYSKHFCTRLTYAVVKRLVCNGGKTFHAVKIYGAPYCTYLEQREKKEIINLFVIVDGKAKCYMLCLLFLFHTCERKIMYALEWYIYIRYHYTRF